MKNVVFSIVALAGVAGIGCGASMQPPTDRLAATEAAIRSAQELGAASDPQAALHLKLAQEQVDQARKVMHDGDNKRADLVLQRAKSDAELSVVLVKERAAQTEAQKARQILEADKQGK